MKMCSTFRKKSYLCSAWFSFLLPGAFFGFWELSPIVDNVFTLISKTMKTESRLFLLQAFLVGALTTFAQTSGFQKLDEWTEIWKTGQQTYFGYPANQQSEMRDFYK